MRFANGEILNENLITPLKIVDVLGPWDYEWFNIFKFL